MPNKPLVLCIDDEQNILDLLSFNLEATGYEAVTATDASFTDRPGHSIANRELHWGDDAPRQPLTEAGRRSFPTPGHFAVTLLVTDSDGTTARCTVDLVVTDAPPAPAAELALTPTSCRPGEIVLAQDLSPNWSGDADPQRAINWGDDDVFSPMPDREARHVEIALAVGVGHLGGLAAGERRAGLHAALGLLDEIGVDRIAGRIADWLTEAERLLGGAGLDPGPPAGVRRGILTFRPPAGSAEDFVARAGAAGVMLSARRGRVRLSPHFYNADPELAALAKLTLMNNAG